MHTPELEKYSEMYEIFSGMDTDAEHHKIFTEKTGAKTYDNEGAFLNDLQNLARTHMEDCRTGIRQSPLTCHLNYSINM